MVVFIRVLQFVLFLLVIGCPMLLRAQTSSPAAEAYQRVTPLRDAHADVIWGDASASAGELQAILVDLQTGLRQLDTPLVRDLGEGSMTLRFRRYNFLTDIVKVQARLGDRDAAISTMLALGDFAWTPDMQARWQKDAAVAALLDDPRLAPLRDRQRIATRWEQAETMTASDPASDVSARIAGLSMLWANARDGFVWFDNVPELDWDQAYLDAVPEVIDATSLEDYYRVLMRFVAQLGDGHSNVYVPEALQDRFYARPGLRTARIEGRVVVTAITDADLERDGVRVGDELLTIEGESVDAHAATTVLPYVSSSTPQDREVRTYTYQLLSGPADRAVALSLRRADGSLYGIEALRRGYPRVPPRNAPLLRWHGDVAVLEARQFEDAAALQALEASLAELMAARALVIDLRGNGGGSSSHGWNILSYLSHAPIPLPTSHYREHSAFARARGFDLIEWRQTGGTPWSNPREQVFAGKVAVLIDAQTFSAAEDTAAAFRLMARGPILGSASGGSTGQPWGFDLPGGGSARICVKRDTWPDGSRFVGVGIVPDIQVQPGVDDIRAGRDPVLERALETLRGDG